MEQWTFAEVVWIPKEEGSEFLDQFPIISLLNTECKIFSGYEDAFQTSFLEMATFDTSVQKSGVSGMPSSLEHTGGLTLLLREAKQSKGDLIVLLLELANA